MTEIYENLHSFKDGMILLCWSILKTRRILYLHDLTFFTIPLKVKPMILLNYLAIITAISNGLIN